MTRNPAVPRKSGTGFPETPGPAGVITVVVLAWGWLPMAGAARTDEKPSKWRFLATKTSIYPQLFQRWDRELGTQFLPPGA
ncbi:hypothetical protein [Saccharopolyspora elongata]|uniref:Uncharacterized protein n=1 Tax=Saccharopolyspora elongata TaxID=2530387 RepID=A0A4R4YBA8_9PSEU|nr:hypothetical protein [Saccharopolyspora elongata]TDD41918.1 hypothetical protein E1288_31170 [Saccharopolyspora elongata]